MRSGSKCGYESGDLVTVRDEGGWHDNCGKEQCTLCKSLLLDKSTILLQDKCGNEQYISTEMKHTRRRGEAQLCYSILATMGWLEAAVRGVFA